MLSAAKHLAGVDGHFGDAGSFSTMVMLTDGQCGVLDASGALPPQHDVWGELTLPVLKTVACARWPLFRVPEANVRSACGEIPILGTGSRCLFHHHSWIHRKTAAPSSVFRLSVYRPGATFGAIQLPRCAFPFQATRPSASTIVTSASSSFPDQSSRNRPAFGFGRRTAPSIFGSSAPTKLIR